MADRWQLWLTGSGVASSRVNEYAEMLAAHDVSPDSASTLDARTLASWGMRPADASAIVGYAREYDSLSKDFDRLLESSNASGVNDFYSNVVLPGELLADQVSASRARRSLQHVIRTCQLFLFNLFSAK